MSLTREQKRTLVDLLLSVPPASSFEGRTVLLGDGHVLALNRNQNNARLDLEGIVQQLEQLRDDDGLTTVIENAIDYIRGSSMAGELEALLHEARMPAASSPSDPAVSAHLEMLLSYVDEHLQASVLDVFNTSEVLAPDLEKSGGAPAVSRRPEAYRSRLPRWLNSVEAHSRSFSSLRDAFEHYRGVLLLLGDPGSGKTTSLLSLAREFVQERLRDESVPLPVFAPVNGWKSEPIVSWLERVTELSRATISAAAERRRLVLLLDGLDELDDDEDCIDFLRSLNRLGDVSVLLTCRRRTFEVTGPLLGGSRWHGGVVTLTGFTDNQIERYLESHPVLLEAVRTDAELRHLARQPLLLTILATTYEGMRDAALQLGDLRRYHGVLREEIFRQFVVRRYEHERLKSEHMPLPPVDELYEALGNVAVRMILISRGCNEFKAEDVQASYGGDTALLLTVAENLHLVRRVGAGGFRFLHLLLRDHIALACCSRHILSSDAQERAMAVQTLCQMEEDTMMDVFLVLLADPDPFVLRSALRALSRVDQASVVRRLIDVVPHLTRFGDRMLEYELVNTLAIVGRSHVPLLLDTLGAEEDKAKRDVVGSALTNLRHLLQAPPLLDLLGSAIADVRWWAARLLASLGPPVPGDLLPLLRSADVRLRVAAIETVGLIDKDALVANVLAPHLEDPSVKVRSASADSLGKWASKRSAVELSAELGECLLRLLVDRDESVRRAAAFAVGHCRVGSAVEPLLSLLHDENDEVCVAAVASLGVLGDRRAVPHLESALENATAPEVCWALSKALSALGHAPPRVRAILDKAVSVTVES